MKNRYSIYKNLYGASACLLTACMVLTACDTRAILSSVDFHTIVRSSKSSGASTE